MNNSSLKLSVLLVTYNSAEYVAEAIESILMQRVDFGYEILVADDCSTDNTLAIIKRYQLQVGTLIKIIPAAQNLGITKNYQRALAECTGQYIAILEGDDYWISPHKLSTQVEFLERNTLCSFCCHQLVILNQNKQTISLSNDINRSTAHTQDLILDNFIGNFSSCMYRMDVVKKILATKNLFDLKIYDWMFNIINAEFGLIGFISKPLSVYRLHDSGVWASKTAGEKIKDTMMCIDQYNAFLHYKYNSAFNKCKRRYAFHMVMCVLEANIILRQSKNIIIILLPPIIVLILRKVVCSTLVLVSSILGLLEKKRATNRDK